jgi:hypothetical protein
MIERPPNPASPAVGTPVALHRYKGPQGRERRNQIGDYRRWAPERCSRVLKRAYGCVHVVVTAHGGFVLPRVEVRERLPVEFFDSSCLSVDVLEHHTEDLTPVDRRVGCPFKDRVNLIPDGLPFGALTSDLHPWPPELRIRSARFRAGRPPRDGAADGAVSADEPRANSRGVAPTKTRPSCTLPGRRALLRSDAVLARCAG